MLNNHSEMHMWQEGPGQGKLCPLGTETRAEHGDDADLHPGGCWNSASYLESMEILTQAAKSQKSKHECDI